MFDFTTVLASFNSAQVLECLQTITLLSRMLSFIRDIWSVIAGGVNQWWSFSFACQANSNLIKRLHAHVDEQMRGRNKAILINTDTTTIIRPFNQVPFFSVLIGALSFIARYKLRFINIYITHTNWNWNFMAVGLGEIRLINHIGFFVKTRASSH